MTPDKIKLFLQLMLFCLVAGGPATIVWFERNDHWNGVMEKAKADDEQKKNEAVANLNQTITNLGAQHEKDLADIADLRRHPVRVQLPAPSCSGTVSEAGGSQLSASVPIGTSKTAQQSFDDFTNGMADDAAEWGAAIAACKVMQDYIKKLP